jgi:hypothetical protein
MLSFSSKVLLIVLNFVRAGTMSTQAKLRKIAEAANALKGKTATASTAPTPPPSAVASPSPSLEVVGEKRGLPEVVEDQGPPKHHRGPGDSTALTEGLHRLQPGVPAEKFVLPPAFSHGSKMLDGQTKVVVTPADQAVLDNMGPVSLKNELADATVAAFKLMEIANFLNGRESKYLEERDDAQKRLKKRGRNFKGLVRIFERWRRTLKLIKISMLSSFL